VFFSRNKLAENDRPALIQLSRTVFHEESNGEGHTTVLARFLSAKRSAYELPSLLNFAKQWPGTGPLDASILLPINGFQSSSFYLRKGPFNSSLLPGGVVVVAGVTRVYVRFMLTQHRLSRREESISEWAASCPPPLLPILLQFTVIVELPSGMVTDSQYYCPHSAASCEHPLLIR